MENVRRWHCREETEVQSISVAVRIEPQGFATRVVKFRI